MEDNAMVNLDIKDFGTVQSLADTDYVVISLGGGTSAKVSVGLLKSLFTATISPSIVDGVWHIGGTSLDVEAVGKTPEMRKGSLGIEYKYTTEDDTDWKLLVAYTDIKLQYDALTDAQKEEIIAGVATQVHDDVIVPVEEAITTANEAAQTAVDAGTEAVQIATEASETAIERTDKAIDEVDSAIEKAKKATESAEKYANRVVDLSEEEWEAMEEAGTWVEGVEYNVYEV